jgi:hypothetical protein
VKALPKSEPVKSTVPGEGNKAKSAVPTKALADDDDLSSGDEQDWFDQGKKSSDGTGVPGKTIPKSEPVNSNVSGDGNKAKSAVPTKVLADDDDLSSDDEDESFNKIKESSDDNVLSVKALPKSEPVKSTVPGEGGAGKAITINDDLDSEEETLPKKSDSAKSTVSGKANDTTPNDLASGGDDSSNSDNDLTTDQLLKKLGLDGLPEEEEDTVPAKPAQKSGPSPATGPKSLPPANDSDSDDAELLANVQAAIEAGNRKRAEIAALLAAKPDDDSDASLGDDDESGEALVAKFSINVDELRKAGPVNDLLDPDDDD